MSPDQAQHYVEVAFEAAGALSLVLAALRPVLNRIPPGPARSWVDGFDALLHVLAGNSRRLADRVAPPKGKQ